MADQNCPKCKSLITEVDVVDGLSMNHCWGCGLRGTPAEMDRMCNHEEAMRCYNQVLKADPSYSYAWLQIGCLQAMQGQHGPACTSYKKSLKLSPDDDVTLNYLGISLGKLGKLNEALACFERALEINPDDTEALNNRDLTLDAMGRE